MEKENRKGLIYEFPMGVAVLKGGNSLQIDIANAEFMKAIGHGEQAEPERSRDFYDCVYLQDAGAFEDMIEKCREQKRAEEIEVRIISGQGQICWVKFWRSIYYYKDAVPYYLLICKNTNDRKELEDELLLLNEQYSMLEEVTDDVPFEYDVKGKRFRIPHKYHINGRLQKDDQDYMEIEKWLAFIHKDEQTLYREVIQNASEREMSGSFDYRMNTALGGGIPQYCWYRTVYRSIRGTNGKILKIIGRSYDISSDRKIQEQLSEEMRRDPLTHLYNKVATGEEAERILKEYPEGTHVLFLIDIDNFKSINDTFGHTVGDTVISDIASALEEQFPDHKLVGRVGGDEFLVLMDNTTLKQAEQKAKELCRHGEKKLVGDDAVIHVTMSVGLAVSGQDGNCYTELFDQADRAMYAIKRSGKSNYAFAGKNKTVHTKRNIDTCGKDVDYEKKQGMDKEFLNTAFLLLSHARDMNGSLNVLLERIGRRYHLDMVAVFEYDEQIPQMTLTNYWSTFGQIYEKNVIKPIRTEVVEAGSGDFVILNDTDETHYKRLSFENWNTGENRITQIAVAKFEYSGSKTGGLYFGVQNRQNYFESADRTTFCELARVTSVFVSLRNKLRDDQKEIRHLQDRDQLTGLYNLEAFKYRLKNILAEAKQGQEHYALVHIDIDKFSYVNENYGQQTGDAILKDFAGGIQTNERVLLACRMYSDYFILLLKGKDQSEIEKLVAWSTEHYEEKLKKRYPSGTLRLSVGICHIENLNEKFDTILESANLARKLVKEQGGSGICVYKEEMRAKRDDAIQITGRFYGAMQQGELEVYLQPKFNLEERKIYGAEALARWRTKTGEMIMPGRFVPPLENIGYVVDLDFYIYEQLLRAMKRWKKAGKELFTISTNFSRRNFESGGKNFAGRLKRMADHYGIDPKYIEVEVTESVVVENVDELKRVLSELEKFGFRIAIDDFGTGYSSLGVLLEIPADVVKIDKSFTDRINLKEQRNFVSQMGNFIHSAKEEVIFEGIETEEQLQFLRGCGFLYGQGYLFDRPIPLEEFERKYM